MRAGSLITVSWSGIGPVAAISESVPSSVTFQPWITMLSLSSSSHTVGDPLFGESGSTPMNRSAMAAFLTGVCTSLHPDHQPARTAKSRPEVAPPWRSTSALGSAASLRAPQSVPDACYPVRDRLAAQVRGYGLVPGLLAPKPPVIVAYSHSSISLATDEAGRLR
jgi:hypothetical protein